MQCVNGSASQTSWTDQLDRPDKQTSWMDQLDRPAGRTSWTDQLDGPAGQTSWTDQFAYSKIDLSVCIVSRLPSPTKALFCKVQGIHNRSIWFERLGWLLQDLYISKLGPSPNLPAKINECFKKFLVNFSSNINVSLNPISSRGGKNNCAYLSGEIVIGRNQNTSLAVEGSLPLPPALRYRLQRLQRTAWNAALPSSPHPL